ncbi:hypothetical protein ONE63_006098 [Megalurothrips usitatus]|uniref:NADH:ubiquinone oxidoreductase intermediate-associated protein 30 domain-containing protein n=1 Tax=Megalurothrips usitatus TaxID=439358 RepID=A0AAV7XT01_9NEOP|nr:hypothetical protein ONE63_006098 [Megalurothrips usitatus]KAJ1529304.1 hypothetical protein ONE63_006098 [Megalurothrips usitatus]
MLKLTLRISTQLVYSTATAKNLSCVAVNQRYNVTTKRSFHISTKRKGLSFWEPNKRGTSEYDKEDTTSDLEHFKRGSKMLIPETKKWFREMKDYFSQDLPAHLTPNDHVTDKYFSFNGPDSLENWVVSTDSDWNGGFTTGNISISPSGTGVFSGNLCTQVPKSGTLENAGFANLRFVPPLKSFGREPVYVFVAYTHLVLRVRGDGRNYLVNLHPHAFFDIHHLNMFTYVLHTRGGPYWQETKIPFSKFFLHYKGRMQDRQTPIDLQNIRNFSISLMDQNNGPFRLEIDYVGCEFDPGHTEEHTYEEYYVPRWTGIN